MPYLVTQTIASLSDPDIMAVDATEALPPAKEYLVLEHAPLGLEVMPDFTVAGQSITFGAPGSAAQYIAVRISDVQTVIQKTVHPIGEGIIGVNFSIA